MLIKHKNVEEVEGWWKALSLALFLVLPDDRDYILLTRESGWWVEWGIWRDVAGRVCPNVPQNL